MNQNNTLIEIAIASDSNYLIPTTVMLKSLFDNNKKNRLSINLLYLSSCTEEKDCIFWKEYVESYGHKFNGFPISDDQLSVYPEIAGYKKSIFLRLLLPELIDISISKILYLDTDIIVTNDLLPLYKTDISNYYAAAAKDVLNIYAITNDFIRMHINNLGIKSGKYYFNSGIMLMDLSKMRKMHITSKCFEFAQKHLNYLRWPDQDILNAIIGSSIKYIHPKYNMNYDVEPDVLNKMFGIEEVKEAKKNPVIIHYMGSTKPWTYISYHPLTHIWWNYLKKTPYKNYRPQNISYKQVLYKYYLKISKMANRNIPLSYKQILGKCIPNAIKKKIKASIS